MLVSKEYKREIINSVVSLIKKLNISDKTFGFFMRAFHVNLPVYCVIIMIYGNQFMNICTLFMLSCASISFIAFDGCMLSMVEKELDNEDITVVDPYLEMMGFNTTNRNRMNISIVIAVFYMCFAFFVYYMRFSVTPHFIQSMQESTS